MLNKQSGKLLDKNKDNYNKLLVILVDFQEEIPDDPNTTGNGKFQLEPDPNYLYSIGSPPHNRKYFQDNLEALRYYYLAATAGSFNLEYDVYPINGAYTLPILWAIIILHQHPMKLLFPKWKNISEIPLPQRIIFRRR
ncbi:MAG TPA: hypothetical protein PK126_03295 [Candidatus Syntrophosphaera thermopropionivorans]|nr:hypothetical protein [Candidatus Syntrophosphaera thermopropionivorans]